MSKFPRILHYPGSKWSMAEWIISKFPEHETYLEPFFGSGAVFFNKAITGILFLALMAALAYKVHKKSIEIEEWERWDRGE